MEVNRTYLESLSSAELISLSEEYGIDIPCDLERIFIIEELLEYTQSSKEESEENININPSYSDTALLPKQYNISFIDVIIRDPLWIYALWEVKECDKETHINSPDFKGYFLRIVSLNKDNSVSAQNSFTIPVEINDNARYLGFSEHSSLSTGCYMVKLGVIMGEDEIQIASSQPFCMPYLVKNEDIQKMKENTLLRLSGITDLPIIIDIDKKTGRGEQ